MTAPCLRGRDGRSVWRDAHSEPPFDHRRHHVVPVPDAAARAFVEQHHYSHAYVASRLAYGLFDGFELVGVAVLSVPAQRRVLTNVFPTLEPYYESVELGRFVLLDRVAANAESWMLGEVGRLAAADGVRGVVSFSDPMPRATADGQLVTPGHVGVIYQATNAAYLGRGTARTLLMLDDGTVLNDRALAKVRAQDRGHEYVERRLVAHGARPLRAGEDPARWLRRALEQTRVRRFCHPGNHRYAFRFGNRAERRRIPIGLAARPYPKAGVA